MVTSKFSMQFRGYGFDRKLDDKGVSSGEPNQQIITEITGPGIFS